MTIGMVSTYERYTCTKSEEKKKINRERDIVAAAIVHLHTRTCIYIRIFEFQTTRFNNIHKYIKITKAKQMCCETEQNPYPIK